VRKTCDGFALYGNAMSVDIFVKRFAEGNSVLRDIELCVGFRPARAEPEPHVIEKVKTGEVDESGPTGPLICSEKDSRSKDTLKSSN
jgi:hypothetical protein